MLFLVSHAGLMIVFETFICALSNDDGKHSEEAGMSCVKCLERSLFKVRYNPFKSGRAAMVFTILKQYILRISAKNVNYVSFYGSFLLKSYLSASEYNCVFVCSHTNCIIFRFVSAV